MSLQKRNNMISKTKNRLDQVQIRKLPVTNIKRVYVGQTSK